MQTTGYVFYPDPVLPLSTVNYCAQSCDVLQFRKQLNDRSSADSTTFREGKTIFSAYSNNYNVYTVSSSVVTYTSPPGQGTPFPTFRSHADYIKYKRMTTVLTQNYKSDTQT